MTRMEDPLFWKSLLSHTLDNRFPCHSPNPLQSETTHVHVFAVARVIADVEVLAGALALSRTVLEEDPCQLASQLIGRLGQILADDRPVAPGTTTSQPPGLLWLTTSRHYARRT